MFREHVLLALSLLLGMLFIIDLYIAAVYINTWNAYKRKQPTYKESKRNPLLRYKALTDLFDEPADFPEVKDRGTPNNDNTIVKDYGLNLRNAPESAVIFKYYFYPFQGHLSILIPGDKLKEIKVSESDILNYVVRQIMYSLKMEDVYYLDTPLKTGHIWVRSEVLKNIARRKREEELEMEEMLLRRRKRRRRHFFGSFDLSLNSPPKSIERPLSIELLENETGSKYNHIYNFHFQPLKNVSTNASIFQNKSLGEKMRMFRKRLNLVY